MKQKSYIVFGVALLLAAVVFIARDLFWPRHEKTALPDAVDSLKVEAPLLYRPLFSFSPEMDEIKGLVAGSDQKIYICGSGTVEVRDERGKMISSFKIPGTAGCVTTDGKGNILLGMEDELLILDNSGKKRISWKLPDTASVITSVSADGKDVFVADAGLRNVFRYDYSGKMIKRIGDADPARKIPGFIIPSPYFDLRIKDADTIWIANPGRHELEKYTFSGDLVSKWGTPGMTPDAFCGCCNPSNFTVLSDGSFITCEKGIPRVKIYDRKGNFLGMVADSDQFEDDTRGIDVTADLNDRIWVLDPLKKKITVYVKS